MRIQIINILAFVLMHSVSVILCAQSTLKDEPPLIGAQVIIEKGQTAEEIDVFFRRLAENNMKTCRIRMFEVYMKDARGNWDMSLFDHAFKSAEKYGIKVFATFFPATSFSDVGGFKFPATDAHFQSIKEYIRAVVPHFAQYKSLYGWVLVNEPGVSGKLPEGEFTRKHFENWKEENPNQETDGNGYHLLNFEQEKFLLYYNAWYLNELAKEVRKYDGKNEIHVNNHNIFGNIAEYKFNEWSKFLTSLGGSAHASWHFGYFTRPLYAVALSANSEIIRSGADGIPWLMTELQGGNNTFSGENAMCPTPEEITQWLWTVIASESKGAIFWCLNPRNSGFEAGEWGMLDYQNNPTERLLAAKVVGETIEKNKSLFTHAQVMESGISILYTRESMWIEKRLKPLDSELQGRLCGGVIKSALGYFEALSEMGVQSNLKAIDEFDFSKKDYQGQTIILAHQISIPDKYLLLLEQFVERGGTLWMDGLTGYYDENAVCRLMHDFPLEKITGAKLKEFRLTDNVFSLTMVNPDLLIPAHAWTGVLLPKEGVKVISKQGKEVTGISHRFGKGKSIWIPSPLGIGARMEGYAPLQELLMQEVPSCRNTTVRLDKASPGILMKSMQSGDKYVTVIINKSHNEKELNLLSGNKKKTSVLFADKGGKINGNKVIMSPEETMVVLFE